MRRAEHEPQHVRHDEADEADDAAHRHRGAGQHGRRREHRAAHPLDVDAEARRRLLAEEQQVEVARVPARRHRTHGHRRQAHPHVGPRAVVQPAHQPEDHLVGDLPVDDAERDEQGGDGGGQRPEGDAREQQGRDGGAPGAGGDGVDGGEGGQRPREGEQREPEHGGGREPADERDDGAQRRALADADDAGLGQGVAEEPLHLRPRHREGAPHQRRDGHARRADEPDDDLLGLGDAPEVDPAGRQRPRREHPDDGAPRDAGAADGDGRHRCRSEQGREQRQGCPGGPANSRPAFGVGHGRLPGSPGGPSTGRRASPLAVPPTAGLRPDVPDGLRPADRNRDAPRTVSVTARPDTARRPPFRSAPPRTATW